MERTTPSRANAPLWGHVPADCSAIPLSDDVFVGLLHATTRPYCICLDDNEIPLATETLPGNSDGNGSGFPVVAMGLAYVQTCREHPDDLTLAGLLRSRTSLEDEVPDGNEGRGRRQDKKEKRSDERESLVAPEPARDHHEQSADGNPLR